MNKIYLVKNSYHPNDAPTNRFLSFVEGFSQLGIEAEVVFVLADEYNSRIQKTWPNIKVTYLWDSLNIKNRYLRQVSYSILSARFVRQLNPGDTVIVFDVQRMIFSLIRKKGIKVYSERTEHPFAYSVRTVNMDKYIDQCKYLNGLFVISTSLKTFFENVGVQSEKIHIINMTVDPQRFENLIKQRTDFPYIAYCGSASNKKDGVDELLKAFSIVVKQHPNYRLLIIGKGITKEDDTSHLRLIKEFGIEDNVIFTGVVTSDQMPQLLKNADVLALDRPDNLQAEYGFPTKLGEYLLTGNPVVITKVGDIPLFLKDGESALIAEPQNAQAFANKIIWAIEHPEKAAIIGAKGAEVAQKHFNAYNEAKKMAQIIGVTL